MSVKELDFENMSDEEFLALDPATFESAAPVEEPVVEEEVVADADDTASTDDAPAEESAEAVEDADDAAAEGEAAKRVEAPAEKPATEAKKAETPAEKPVEVDYKALYEQVMAPFKANGKEMKVESAEDVRSLMQQGANYNKKMAALKPSLKVLKLLENNGLLDESKLSYLIDLDKKDPKAILKLVKDSGLDPLDMDVSKESEYKATPRTVDDRELALDQVLEEIQDTPTYTKVVNIVSKQWDAPSRQVIANNPQVLKIINDHMASGIYDVISNEIERERVLGRLTDIPDIEAYKKVGDAIQARGGFDHIGTTQPPKDIPAPKPKAVDPGLKDRKRAASPPSAAPVKEETMDFNPLAMSDTEFEKRFNARLL